MGIHAHEQKLFIYARIQNKLTYFDLFYHFIMGKIGPKFSHLLTVKAEGAAPPLTVSLTIKRPFFCCWWLPKEYNKNFVTQWRKRMMSHCVIDPRTDRLNIVWIPERGWDRVNTHSLQIFGSNYIEIARVRKTQVYKWPSLFQEDKQGTPSSPVNHVSIIDYSTLALIKGCLAQK